MRQTDKVQNDHLFISHFHDPKDGYTYVEDGNDWLSDGQSISSVVHKPASKQHAKVPQLVRLLHLAYVRFNLIECV